MQKPGCSGVGASSNFAGARPIDDAKEQAHHQVTPKQRGEPFTHFGGEIDDREFGTNFPLVKVFKYLGNCNVVSR